MKAEGFNLINLQRLESILSEFYQMTGIPLKVIDKHGKILFHKGARDVCDLYLANEQAKQICDEEHSKVALFHSGCCSKCPHGFNVGSAPIKINEELLGGILLGQFFTEPPNEKEFIIQAEGYGFDVTDYLDKLKRVPIIKIDKLNSYISFIIKVAEIVSNLGLRNFEHQKELQSTLESISDCFCALDDELKFTFINSQAEKFFKRNRSLLLNKKIDEILPQVNNFNVINVIRRAVLKKEIIHGEEYSEKSNRWFEFHLYPTSNGVSIYFNDATERKKDQEMLLRISKAVNNSSDAIAIANEKGQPIYFNKAFTDIFGPIQNGANIFSPKSNNIASSKLRQQVSEGVSKKGSFSGEIEKLSVTGNKLTLFLRADAITDDCGKVIGYMGIYSDITEKKRIEREMIRLDQLNLVGEMAAGLGHEVRNPMQTVRGFLQMLQGIGYAEHQEYFDLMISEIDRANSIITEFLTLAKNKAVDKQPHNLNVIITNMYPLLKSDAFLADNNIKLMLNELPQILVDEKEIRQLIINLVRNGLEVMDSGKTLTIMTYYEDGKVHLKIIDQGKGIPKDVYSKLGTPFLTTKDNGTGLGLAVCYSIAARHHAKIEVETGKTGTTFDVVFPAGLET